MIAELQVPFKQARYFHAGRVSKPIWIVVHDIGVLKSEGPDTAESTQDFFVHTTVEASAHMTADINSLARSVHDWDTAWGAPGVNSNGLHLEQAGGNQNHDGWRDAYSKKMIEEQSAKAVADWSVRHDIPLVKRGPADINANRGGIIGHYDASNAFHTAGGHTDPDTDYPWNWLIAAAHEHVGDVAQPHVHHNPYHRPHFDATHRPFSSGTTGPKVRFVEWALSLDTDGVFGRGTFAAVKAFQRKHNLHVDGVVGPQTAAVLATMTRVW